METNTPPSTGTATTSVSKQVRLRIGTDDTDELFRFFVLVVQPCSKNLSTTVKIFNEQLIPLFDWLSHSAGKESWKWHTRIKRSYQFHSIRYSRHDGLLDELQDPQFRNAFEEGFRLWQEYSAIFLCVLNAPTNAEVVAEKARNWFGTHAANPAAVRKSSRSLLRLLCSQQEMARWVESV